MVCCVSTVLVKPTVKPGSNVGGAICILFAKRHVTSLSFPSLAARSEWRQTPIVISIPIKGSLQLRVASQNGRPWMAHPSEATR